jgi:hypothetical protein
MLRIDLCWCSFENRSETEAVEKRITYCVFAYSNRDLPHCLSVVKITCECTIFPKSGGSLERARFLCKGCYLQPYPPKCLASLGSWLLRKSQKHAVSIAKKLTSNEHNNIKININTSSHPLHQTDKKPEHQALWENSHSPPLIIATKQRSFG